MSDTPLTDAEAFDVSMDETDVDNPEIIFISSESGECVTSLFARRLERENARLKAIVEGRK